MVLPLSFKETSQKFQTTLLLTPNCQNVDYGHMQLQRRLGSIAVFHWMAVYSAQIRIILLQKRRKCTFGGNWLSLPHSVNLVLLLVFPISINVSPILPVGQAKISWGHHNDFSPTPHPIYHQILLIMLSKYILNLTASDQLHHLPQCRRWLPLLDSGNCLLIGSLVPPIHFPPHSSTQSVCVCVYLNLIVEYFPHQNQSRDLVCFARCCLPYQTRVVRADFSEERALELRMNEEEPAAQMPRRAVQAKGIAKCEGSTVQ